MPWSGVKGPPAAGGAYGIPQTDPATDTPGGRVFMDVADAKVYTRPDGGQPLTCQECHATLGAAPFTATTRGGELVGDARHQRCQVGVEELGRFAAVLMRRADEARAQAARLPITHGRTRARLKGKAAGFDHAAAVIHMMLASDP